MEKLWKINCAIFSTSMIDVETGDGSLDGALAQIFMLDALETRWKGENCGMERDDATANQRTTIFHAGKTWSLSIFSRDG
jgi:hypothetical protein